MGIEHRIEQLLGNPENLARLGDLQSEYDRLLGNDQMGKVYKVLYVGTSWFIRRSFPFSFSLGVFGDPSPVLDNQLGSHRGMRRQATTGRQSRCSCSVELRAVHPARSMVHGPKLIKLPSCPNHTPWVN